MLKKSFRHDIITLKTLYAAFAASESFYASDEEMNAYNRYYEHLTALCSKYGKTPRQIANAMNF